MAGQDWDSIHKRYRPLVDRLGSHDDLVDLLWELHGELGTSHAYVRPAMVTENGSNGQGRLGADLAFTRRGLGDHAHPCRRVVRSVGHLAADPPGCCRQGRGRAPRH